MAATTGIMLPVGARYFGAYLLNAGGVPYPTTTGASSTYEGIQVTGSRAFTLTLPDPRTIDHPGQDTLQQRDQLPPLTGAEASLTDSKVDYPLHALLSGTLMNTVGESVGIGLQTDKMGYEPQVGLMMFQQAEDASSTSVEGLRRWRVVFAPKAFVVAKKPGMGDAPEDSVYNVVAQVSRTELWGLPFTLNANGFLRAQFREFMCEGRPMLVSWRSADATPVKFLFSTSHPATATTKIHAISLYTATTGVISDISSTATKAVDGITPASIAANDIVTAFYEW